MKAAMDLIYLVSCAVNEEKPDAEKCAAMKLDEVYAVAERHSLRSAAAVADAAAISEARYGSSLSSLR